MCHEAAELICSKLTQKAAQDGPAKECLPTVCILQETQLQIKVSVEIII